MTLLMHAYISHDMIPVPLSTRTNAELPQSTTSEFKAAEMPPIDQNSMVREP